MTIKRVHASELDPGDVFPGLGLQVTEVWGGGKYATVQVLDALATVEVERTPKVEDAKPGEFWRDSEGMVYLAADGEPHGYTGPVLWRLNESPTFTTVKSWREVHKVIFEEGPLKPPSGESFVAILRTGDE